MRVRYPANLAFALLIAPGCREAGRGSQYEPSPCPFTVPAGARVDCGTLTVPEDHARPGGRTLRLPVAIYRSSAAGPAPDPIVWLVGGPGGRAHVLSSATYARTVAPYIAKRDFIVMDIRGTGYARPALDCGAMEPGERGLRNCRDRLARIADLSRYDSASVARDLDGLRRALGYRQWNLLGQSYGTRLALTAMRDRPEGIRAVILDSVVAPQVDALASGPSWMAESLESLFRNCAADRRCGAAFPKLRETLAETAAALDREPLRIQGEAYGTKYAQNLNGAAMMSTLRIALYESDLIPQIPRAIYRAGRGREDEAWQKAVGLHAVIWGRLVDLGAYYSVACRESLPFASVAKLRLEDERLGWLRHAASGFTHAEACRWWGVPPAPALEHEPVSSGIPALLLAGEYDPATPPSNAHAVARSLSRSHVFVFPGLGHWVTANPVSDCPTRIALEFLEDPTRKPASGCIPQMRVNWAVD